MRTVSIFKDNANQAIRFPKDALFQGLAIMEIWRKGGSILLQPARPNWSSFADEPLADEDFLIERPPVLQTDRFDIPDIRDDAEGSGQ